MARDQDPASVLEKRRVTELLSVLAFDGFAVEGRRRVPRTEAGPALQTLNSRNATESPPHPGARPGSKGMPISVVWCEQQVHGRAVPKLSRPVSAVDRVRGIRV